MSQPDEHRWGRLVGLARRSGRASVGRAAVRHSLRNRSARLVILTSDAGDALCREMSRSSAEAEVPLIEAGDRSGLGRILGRAEVAVISINDPGLARAVREALSAGSTEQEARDRAHGA